MKRLTKFAKELMQSPPTIWDEVMPDWARGLLAAKPTAMNAKKKKQKKNEKNMDVGQKD